MTAATTPKFAYALAIAIGIIPFFFLGNEPNLLLFAVFFLSAGALLGYFWPQPSWRWGLWLAGPIAGSLALSLLFAGNLDAFLKNDLPFVIIPFAATIGSFISSQLRIRLNQNHN